MNNFLWSIASKKFAKILLQYVIAHLSRLALDKYGLSVSIDHAITEGAILSGLELGRNFVKTKTGWKFL